MPPCQHPPALEARGQQPLCPCWRWGSSRLFMEEVRTGMQRKNPGEAGNTALTSCWRYGLHHPLPHAPYNP